MTFEVQKLSKDFAVVGQAINTTEEEAKSATGTCSLKVTNISHVEPATINADLFDKVFGKDVVKTEDEFMNKIRETIAENYERESNHLLEHEIQHHLNDHTKVNMPDQFLKTWLKSTGDGTITDEIIEKEFNEYRNGLKWDLIKTKIAEDHQIKVDGTEVRNRAKELIAQQFGGPAIAEQLGDKFDSIADNYLSGQDGKGENFMRLYNQIRQEKIMKVVKDSVTIQNKKVSLDEFKELAAAHQH